MVFANFEFELIDQLNSVSHLRIVDIDIALRRCDRAMERLTTTFLCLSMKTEITH